MRLFLKPFFDFSDQFCATIFAVFGELIFALIQIRKNLMMKK
jgi:hypothetical protein